MSDMVAEAADDRDAKLERACELLLKIKREIGHEQDCCNGESEGCICGWEEIEAEIAEVLAL